MNHQKVRTECPICGSNGDLLLDFTFGEKLGLPTKPALRFCDGDNFAFMTGANRDSYNNYYSTFVNDYRHRETPAASDSPVVRQLSNLRAALPNSVSRDPIRVLDYGCGEADLLVALAQSSPRSEFTGYDTNGRALEAASKKIVALGLTNVKTTRLISNITEQKYDLIIASHVFEHLVDFDALATIGKILDH